jgi:hypothetical protein
LRIGGVFKNPDEAKGVGADLRSSDESETFIRRSRKRRFSEEIFEPPIVSKNAYAFFSCFGSDDSLSYRRTLTHSSPASGLMTLSIPKPLFGIIDHIIRPNKVGL